MKRLRTLTLATFGALLLVCLHASAAAAAYCSTGLYYAGQRSTVSVGGSQAFIRKSNYATVHSTSDHVGDWQGPVYDVPGSCNAILYANMCWEQDGIVQGSAGAAGKSISTLYPQIYWETNNPYGYDIHLVPGAFVTPGSNVFVNAYATGARDANGLWWWTAYYSPDAPNWGPVNIGSSPLAAPTLPYQTASEVYQAYSGACAVQPLTTFGGNAAGAIDPGHGLKNTPYPAINWTLWTSPVIVQPSAPSPYFYAVYQNYWYFQTAGG